MYGQPIPVEPVQGHRAEKKMIYVPQAKMKPLRKSFNETTVATIRQITTALRNGSQPSVGKKRKTIQGEKPRRNLPTSLSSRAIMDCLLSVKVLVSLYPRPIFAGLQCCRRKWGGSFSRKKWLTLSSTVVHVQAVGATGRSPLHRTDARKKVLRFVNQF